MYIDAVPNRKSPPAVLLRESFRKNGKVKKRTLANLSKLSKDKIDKIKFALFGKEPITSFSETTSGPVYGTLFVLYKLAEESGIIKVLGKSRMARLSLFLVLARLAHQGSKLSATKWAKDHAVKEILGVNYFDENDLYDALDWIYSKQEEIENKLYSVYLQRNKGPATLFLYDVTSSYLEGECNELAKYGYNRDGKRGKKQIVIGLLTAPDGEPLSIEVFEGNTQDTQTLSSQIDKLTGRFKVAEIIFVGDRGMIKQKGKQQLAGNYFKYITAITDPQIRKLINEKIIQLSFFDEVIFEVEHDQKRLILRCNPATKRKEGYRRHEKIERLKKKVSERNRFVLSSSKADPQSGLNKLKSWARDYKISSFVELKVEGKQIECIIDEEGRKDDGLLDGCYCLESNVTFDSLSKKEIHDYYMALENVERDFRKMKTTLLEIRPIFVRKENRTRGHVLVSMLGLKVARLMEKKLRSEYGTTADNKDAETIESALMALSRLCLHNYRIGEENIVCLPRPDSRQEKILSALKIEIKTPR